MSHHLKYRSLASLTLVVLVASLLLLQNRIVPLFSLRVHKIPHLPDNFSTHCPTISSKVLRGIYRVPCNEHPRAEAATMLVITLSCAPRIPEDNTGMHQRVSSLRARINLSLLTLIRQVWGRRFHGSGVTSITLSTRPRNNDRQIPKTAKAVKPITRIPQIASLCQRSYRSAASRR